MPTYAPQMPHGEIAEIFDDVFFVTGTARPSFGGQTFQISRNMTIVRSEGELTLINTMRLDEPGLTALEGLGKVKNIVKLGSYHGMDDAFYRDRYGARQWALPGAIHGAGHNSDAELVAGELPFPSASLFVFETSSRPEGILVLEREGGILVSCDSLQNWTEADAFWDDNSAVAMKGMIRPANIGPGWLQAMTPEPRDFHRLQQVAYRHVLPGHGRPLLDEAKEQYERSFEALLGI